MMRHVVRLLVVSALAGMCAVVSSAVSGAKVGPRSRTACTSSASAHQGKDPFKGVCSYLDGREGVVQVALFDKTNNKTYLLSNGDNTQYTASIAKVDILGTWLRRFEKRGTAIPGGIPYSIRFLMEQMIEHSDNSAATGLFYFGGGCKAVSRFNRLIPLNATEVGCQTPTYYGWGNTTTTAADQVALMKVFAYGKPRRVLGSDARAYGLQLMQNIEPGQRFGISCGPWGDSCQPPDYPCQALNCTHPIPGITVALKNGWKTLPTCRQPIDKCPWQVNSTGWVKGEGRDYVLTVLTTEDPAGTGGLFGFNYGIETIQGISKRIWANLG